MIIFGNGGYCLHSHCIQRNILSFNIAMNSIVNWHDGGCIINLYCVKVIKNAKIAMGVHINRKRSR